MDYLTWLLYSSGYLAVAMVFLLVAKLVFDWFTPYSLDKELTEKDNPAAGILITGYLLGVLAVICSVFMDDGSGGYEVPTIAIFQEEMKGVAIYGGMGILFLFLAGIINDKFILNKFSNEKEIIEKQNMSVATIMGMTYIGSGLIIGGSIYGSADVLSAIVMFVIGQIVLVIFGQIYQALTTYDDQKEVGEKQNLAAGMAFGGNILAYSLILMRGIALDPRESANWMWEDRLTEFLYYAICGAGLLVLTRFIADKVFMPKVKTADEIVKDKNINAGLIETAIALTAGMILVFCL